ncbi:hypothetical protein [Mycobacterium deserti]|uniref:Uncharacterized protein n=1 Tax=Mycobacterium deserti TaxID=2978347 RepID=A0ABT2M8S3_9MYCO|nr:hypothetical protein [Mycobacterium deserti]MCT7658668.1 hypothetical protein [Mycobacterium deserti]
MSRRSEQKKARRNKRRATRGANWLPADVLDDLVTTQAAIATDLEAFDQRITERGWTFDEDESDEDFAFWYYEPSSVEDADEMEVAAVTTIWMSADEDAEVVHLMLAGTSDDTEFAPEAFLDHVETIERFRAGNPPPTFAAQ